jgi:hypothetical protein
MNAPQLGVPLSLVVDMGTCFRQVLTTPVRRLIHDGTTLFCETESSLYRLDFDDQPTKLEIRLWNERADLGGPSRQHARA